MAEVARIFSGMQPTGSGELHLGNYLGALRNWIALAESGQYDCLYAVVDAHAATVEYNPKEMPQRIFGTALSYLAAGVDPEHVTLFIQSAVPAHMELAWYLSTVAALGDLHRMTQFKEKSDQHRQNVNAGLFTYPILMAADVLLYKATVIPVGNDQVQHLELAREIARRFNNRYGSIFPEPEPRLTQTPRIMGTDGKSKMSKSRGNSIDLFDSPKRVEKKIKGAFTDPEKLRLGDPGRPEKCNIFTIHKALSRSSELQQIDEDCRKGTLSCGECKKRLRVAVEAELEPIRERKEALLNKPTFVHDVLESGAVRARQLAATTMAEVRDAMGMRLPRSQ